MRSKRLKVAHSTAALLVSALWLAPAASADSSNNFGIYKQHLYSQTSSSSPVGFTSTPVKFSVLGSGSGNITVPGSPSITLPQFVASNSGDLLADGFASESALETVFPNGTYKLTLTGQSTLTYQLSSPLYPASIPQVTNGTWQNGVLVVDPAAAATLNFSSFAEYASAGAAGHMQLQINSATGNDNVNIKQDYATISAGGKSTVSSTPFTSYTIPANTLKPGFVYQCGLIFDTVAVADTTSVAGGISLLVYSNAAVFYVAAKASSAIAAPAINGAVADQSGPLGGSATFTPNVSFGSGQQPTNTSYLWAYNGAFINIDGVKFAIGPGGSLTVNNLTAADAGGYTLVVLTGGGQASSNTAALTIGSGSSSPPSITTQPSPQTVASGSTAVFHVVASGATSYQWLFNGNPLSDGSGVSGSAKATLVISGSSFSNAGSYSCAAANSAGTSTSAAASLSVITTNDIGRLVNISTRAQVGTGGNILIAGIVVGGQGTSGTEPLLIRGSGPALAAFGVTGTLSDPQLQLYSGTNLVSTNNGWGGNAQVAATASAVGAFAWNSTTSHDSALLISPNAGAYTAQIAGAAGDTGVSLVEVYDATPTGTYTPSMPRLVNISARVQVGTGGNILIAGFVIGGSTSRTILIRASGPALAPFGVTGTLPDPKLQLFTGSTLLATNTGWGGKTEIASTAASVGAFAWSNPSSNDSALLVTLPPGAYTAQVSGANNDSGVALVELYEVP